MSKTSRVSKNVPSIAFMRAIGCSTSSRMSVWTVARANRYARSRRSSTKTMSPTSGRTTRRPTRNSSRTWVPRAGRPSSVDSPSTRLCSRMSHPKRTALLTCRWAPRSIPHRTSSSAHWAKRRILRATPRRLGCRSCETPARNGWRAVPEPPMQVFSPRSVRKRWSRGCRPA